MNIRTDVMGSKIHNTQRIASEKVQEVMTRLSTGLRINSAKDDAAGLNISERMKAKINEKKVVQQNIGNTIDLLQTMDGGLSSVSDHLQRMREMAIQAKNGTLSNSDIKSLNNEYQILKDSINKISDSTTYNDLKVLNGTFSFDGIDDYVKIPYQTDMDLLEWTVETWVKPEGTAGEIIYRAPGGHINYEIQYVPGTQTASLWFETGTDADYFVYAPNGSVPLNEWTHIAGTYDGSDLSLFINGELVASQTFNTNPNIGNSQMQIGRGDQANFKGEIKEVRIWSEAKDELQLKENMYNPAKDNTLMIEYKEGKAYDSNGEVINIEVMGNPVPSSINVGLGTGGDVTFSASNPTTNFMGIKNTNVDDEDILNKLDTALDYVNSERTKVGIMQNRLSFEENDVVNSGTNLS